MTATSCSLAVVVFDFDPVGTILGFQVRWQYAAVTAIIFVALVAAGLIAIVSERRHRAQLAADPDRPVAAAEAMRAAEETVRSAASTDAASTPSASVGAEETVSTPVDPAYPGWTPGRTAPHTTGAAATAITTPSGAGPTLPTAAPPLVPDAPPERPATAPGDERPWPVGLRLDDLILIVAGATAGAVVFGRLGWVLLYLDWYREHSSSILDPAMGGLALAGGVAGGILAGLLLAVVLGAPVARWLGVAIVPLLAALAAGKVAMVLGGAGQGLPYAGPWATAFAGPGPWASLAPMIPSYPAQLYEAMTSAGALAVVLLLALLPSFRRHPAALFAVGIGLWAACRFSVAYVWRDPVLVGGLNGDQLVTGGIAVAAALALVAIAVHAWRSRRSPAPAPTSPMVA